MAARVSAAAARVEGLEARCLLAASMISDLNDATRLAEADQFTTIGSTTYFRANDGRHGLELWKTDGATGGTVLVKDIHPGPGSSSIGSLCAMGGKLYFAASDGEHGIELWRSDGTEDGTYMVSDIMPGAASSNPSNITAVGSKVVFQAYHGDFEVWSSGGTGATTGLVKDINTAGSSSPGPFCLANSMLYFAAADSINGRELWKTDGTNAWLVADIAAGSFDSSPQELSFANGWLYFNAYTPTLGREPWVYNGTTATLVSNMGTTLLSSTTGGFTAYNGITYFGRQDGSAASLWRTNGTSAGTWQVKDLAAQTAASMPMDLTVLNGSLYFLSIRDSQLQLWRTDGTEAGTALVKAMPDPEGAALQQAPMPSMLLAGSRLFIRSASGLWSSDGTSAGTVHLAGNLWVNGGMGAAGTAVFAGGGSSLWKSDGTPAGTSIIKEISGGSQDADLGGFVLHKGMLYYTSSVAGAAELWRVGVSSGAPQLVKRFLSTSAASASIDSLCSSGNYLYFRANDGASGAEPWRTDGTAAGSIRLKDIRPGASDSMSGPTASMGGKFYFVAADASHGSELWVSDGTVAGTRMLRDLRAGSSGSNISEMVVAGNRLYFVADGAVNAKELWRSDGTAAGTQAMGPWSVSELTPMGSRLFYNAPLQGDTVVRLWAYDGGSGFTSPAGLTPNHKTVVGDRLYYFTYSGGVSKLWYTDAAGTSATEVKDVGNMPPTSTVSANGRLFWTAANYTGGTNEWWTSNGTGGNGTLMLGAWSWLATSSATVRSLQSKAACVIYDALNGAEIWTSDGGVMGPVNAISLADGAADLDPELLFSSGGTLFFSANDGVHGRELWRMSNIRPNPASVRKATPMAAAAAVGMDMRDAFYDADAGDTLRSVKIASAPAHGTLKLGSTTLGAGRVISATDLANLIYTPASGYFGPDSFKWAASDGMDYGAAEALTITVLGTPTGVAASDGLYTDRVAVSWKAVPGASSYEIWRSNAFSAEILLGVSGTTSFSDRMAVPGQRYSYRVKAVAQNLVGSASAANQGYARQSVRVIAAGSAGKETAAGQAAAPGLFYISRNGSAASAMTVSFLLGGSATRGVDYVLKVAGKTTLLNSVTIPAGATGVYVQLSVRDDARDEPLERAVLSLSATAGYAVAGQAATVSIADND